MIDGCIACDGPLGTTDEVGSLVKLGGHVQVMYRGGAVWSGIQAN